MSLEIVTPILSVRKLSVKFGGVTALTDINLDIPSDDGIFGIIGPNGAGKTTLFNSISGFVRPVKDSEILYKTRNIVGMPIHRIAKLGITRTFQNISLLREQTVRQNIMMGFHTQLNYGILASLLALPRVLESEKRAAQQLADDLDLLGISPRYLDEVAGALPLGLQKKIEVARALATSPSLLLLDEPAGGLNDQETKELAASLRKLRSRQGLKIVLIDHDMNLVMRLCNRLCVLNFGRQIKVGTPKEVREDKQVIEGYLGVADVA